MKPHTTPSQTPSLTANSAQIFISTETLLLFLSVLT